MIMAVISATLALIMSSMPKGVKYGWIILLDKRGKELGLRDAERISCSPQLVYFIQQLFPTRYIGVVDKERIVTKIMTDELLWCFANVQALFYWRDILTDHSSLIMKDLRSFDSIDQAKQFIASLCRPAKFQDSLLLASDFHFILETANDIDLANQESTVPAVNIPEESPEKSGFNFWLLLIPLGLIFLIRKK